MDIELNLLVDDKQKLKQNEKCHKTIEPLVLQKGILR